MRRAPQSECSSSVRPDAGKRTRWDSSRLLSYHYMRVLTAGAAVSRCRGPSAARSHCPSARPSTSSAISSPTAPERSQKFVSIASRTANPLLCHGPLLVNAPRPAYLPVWLFVCSVICVQCVRPGIALQHSHRYTVKVDTLAGAVLDVNLGEKNLLPRLSPPDISPLVQSAASTAGPLRTAGAPSLLSLPRQRRADMAGDSSAQPPQPTSEQSSSASSASTSVRQRCAFCQHCLPCLACPALP